MRNCFVPHCDAFCKKNGILKRMMFSAPKDNFENWKKKLFNKREFRETDRVCERHFDKTQILTHWEHIIDGKLCQLEREKPKIKSSAIPYLNLPETEIVAVSTLRKRGTKSKPEPKRRKQNGKISEQISDQNEKIIEKEVVQQENGNNFDNSFAFHDNSIDVDKEQTIKSTTNGINNDRSEEKRQIFDAVYDDIYEVVLPNTKWGLHRDPEERRYIAFTMFDPNKMNCSIAVKITDTFDLTMIVNGIQKSSENLPQLSVDVLSGIINKLNDTAEKEEMDSNQF